MAKSAFSCGAVFPDVKGLPNWAMKHRLCEAATSSCILVMRVSCSTNASGVRATRRLAVCHHERVFPITICQYRGDSRGQRSKDVWWRVISTGLRVKRLCPGCVDNTPQTIQSVTGKRQDPQNTYGLLHDVNPLAIAYAGGVVTGHGKQVVSVLHS